MVKKLKEQNMRYCDGKLCFSMKEGYKFGKTILKEF